MLPFVVPTMTLPRCPIRQHLSNAKLREKHFEANASGATEASAVPGSSPHVFGDNLRITAISQPGPPAFCTITFREHVFKDLETRTLGYLSADQGAHCQLAISGPCRAACRRECINQVCNSSTGRWEHHSLKIDQR